MNVSKISLSTALLVIFAGTAAGQTLVMDAEVRGTRYCLDGAGLASLRLQLRLTYKNNGPDPAILFRYTPLSGFTLRSERGTPLNDVHEQFSVPQMFDSVSNRSRPDSQLFAVVAPGGSYQVVVEELNIVLKDTESRTSLLGTTASLRVQVETWPANHAAGEQLRIAWEKFGILSLDRIESTPIEVHVEQSPAVTRCREVGTL